VVEVLSGTTSGSEECSRRTGYKITILPREAALRLRFSTALRSARTWVLDFGLHLRSNLGSRLRPSSPLKPGFSTSVFISTQTWVLDCGLHLHSNLGSRLRSSSPLEPGFSTAVFVSVTLRSDLRSKPAL